MPFAPRPAIDPAIRRLMWFFAIVYAVEGAGQAKSGVVWQPLLHFLKEARGWTPVEVSASLAVLDLPWIIKPLYGAMSDFLPLFGYRRRSYLLAASVALVIAFGWVATLTAPAAIIPALVVTALALAIASTICGALLVEAGQRHDASAAFVNQQWLWFNVALMASSALGGMLIDILSPAGALHAAAWIAAAAPLLVIASLTLVHEQRATADRLAMRRRLRGFGTALRSRTLWLIAAFLFCYYFSPGFGTPLYYHLTDRLGFSQAFIGSLSSASAAGWIAGGLLYRFVLARLGPVTLLRLSIMGGVGSTLLYLGLTDPVTAVAIYFLTGVAGMVASIATLTLAAEHCPEGAEGFTFAALMSVINLATPLSDTLGAVLYEHVFASRLAPLILVSAAFTAAVLLFLPFLPVSRRSR
jgi:predicted MFS family arabinose efflux permease